MSRQQLMMSPSQLLMLQRKESENKAGRLEKQRKKQSIETETCSCCILFLNSLSNVVNGTCLCCILFSNFLSNFSKFHVPKFSWDRTGCQLSGTKTGVKEAGLTCTNLAPVTFGYFLLRSAAHVFADSAKNLFVGKASQNPRTFSKM